MYLYFSQINYYFHSETHAQHAIIAWPKNKIRFTESEYRKTKYITNET